MSQHDMDVANGPGLTFRTDMNAALQALASQSSGATAPNPTFPCQIWADTGTGRLRQRNVANTAWVDRGALESSSYLSLTGGTLSGAVNDAPINTIASATLTDIGAATSNVIAINGTATIASLGSITAGARRTVRFLSAMVLAHNAISLILPSGANITTAANDTADFLSLGSGNWICVRYDLANGKALAKDFSFDRSNILGTVSQTGAVPTGAIIERGTNANGTYTKFADGTLICTSEGATITTGTIGAGGSGPSAQTNITLPSTFVNTNFVIQAQAFPNTSWDYYGVQTANAITSNTAAIFLRNGATAQTFNLRFIAIGRWF